ncbi:MAG: 30S ribosomal protein S3, partial [Oscillospiraceae bacterium]
MGQKINPHGFRVGVIMDWDSRWFTSKREFGDTLVEDHKIRTVLKKQLYEAGIPKIEIERTVDSETRAPKVKVNIYCAKAGMVIGRAGAGIEKLRLQIEKICGGKSVNVNIIEVKNADVNAQLVAENIAGQLERRISFRRAMKLCMGRAMRLGAKGIKAQVGGRLGGADIARSEHYHEGTIPLQTLRANIDYGFAEANTTYGKIGVKVWIYKGEILADGRKMTLAKPAVEERPAPRRRDNR